MNIKELVDNPDFNRIKEGECIELVNNNRLEIEFYKYSSKYKKSAHILMEYILENKKIIELDTYFFAIAFLYRNSIELILKAIAFKYITLIEDRKSFIKETHHNLLEIIKKIKPFINNLIEKDKDVYQWLIDYLQNINKIDRESDSFRYPFSITYDKKIKKYLIKLVFEKQTNIDLITFANKFEIVYDLLNSIYQENFDSKIDYNEYKPDFIEEGGDYYGQSVIGWRGDLKNFYPYFTAYTESAAYLYKMIKKNNKLKDDLFIPMCYLYRNGIELGLKRILFEDCLFDLQKALKYIYKNKHKVFQVWKLIKDIIEEHAQAPEGDLTILNAENYIIQLNNIDGASDKFRYPTDKFLNLYFKKKKKYDIDNVAYFFEEILVFLDCVDLMIKEHNKWKAGIYSYL